MPENPVTNYGIYSAVASYQKQPPMSLNIRIPEPCHEDWNQMQPEEQGRHCLSCSKTVVDFTGWEASAIKAYLKANAGKKVCGRFYANQLDEPHTAQEVTPDFLVQQIHQSHLSAVKKIAAIIIVVFGLTASSCNDNVQGKVVRQEIDTITDVMLIEPTVDTAQQKTIQKDPTCTPVTVVKKEEPKMLQGEISMPVEPKEVQEQVLMGDTVAVRTDSLPIVSAAWEHSRKMGAFPLKHTGLLLHSQLVE